MASVQPAGQARERSGAVLSWWSVLWISVAGGLLVGGIVFLFGPPEYTARASVLAGNSAASPLAEMAQAALPDVASAGNGGGTLSVPRLEVILRSLRIRDAVSRQCDLARRLGLGAAEAPSALFKATKTSKPPGGALVIEVTFSGPSRVARCLRLPGGPTTAEVQKLCADAANGYVSALRSYLDESDEENIKFITASRDEVARQLRKLADQMAAFRAKHTIVDPQHSADAVTQETERVTTAYAESMVNRDALKHSLVAVRSKLGRERALRVQTIVTQRNPIIIDLSNKLATSKVALAAALSSGKKPDHPDVLELQSQIGATEKELARVTEEIQMSVTRGNNPSFDGLTDQAVKAQVALVDAQTRCASYRAQMMQAHRFLKGLPAVMRQYGELQLQLDLKGDLLTSMSKRLEVARMDARRESSDQFQVLDTAAPPQQKSGPSTVRSAVMTTLLLAVLLSVIVLRRSGLLGSDTDD